MQPTVVMEEQAGANHPRTHGPAFEQPRASGVTLFNMGIPMLYVVWPYLLLALVPVILLEAVVLARRLGIPGRRALLISALANTLSTVFGVPATWLLYLVTGGFVGTIFPYSTNTAVGAFLALTVGAAWLPFDEQAVHWIVPVAMLVLFVPFCLVSWGMESEVAIRQLPKLSAGTVRRAVFQANVISYLLLATVPASMLIFGW